MLNSKKILKNSVYLKFVRTIVLIFTVFVLIIPAVSCSSLASGLSTGHASVVNGLIIDKGDIITEVSEYKNGRATKLSEKHAQIEFNTGTDLKNITIDLPYYEDNQNKIYISGNYAQVNAKDYITENDFPRQDGYVPLYSIAYNRNKIALAAMINGAAVTIIADLDKNSAHYLLPYQNLYSGTPEINRTFIQCLPIEMTSDGNTLICLETNISNTAAGNSQNNADYFYYCTAYQGIFGTETQDSKSFISQIKTTDINNYYCEIVNNIKNTSLGIQVLAVSDLNPNSGLSGSFNNSGIISVTFYQTAGSTASTSAFYNVNVKALNKNIYCANFTDSDKSNKSDDYLEFWELSENAVKSIKYDLGITIDRNFKDSLEGNSKYFVLNPSRTKVAILYKNIIYIMDLSSNSNGINTAQRINTAEHGSSWDADDAIVFIDDNTIIFNSGTTDGDGRMATLPKFIDITDIN